MEYLFLKAELERFYIFSKNPENVEGALVMGAGPFPFPTITGVAWRSARSLHGSAHSEIHPLQSS